jgi:hypothetical protein
MFLNERTKHHSRDHSLLHLRLLNAVVREEGPGTCGQRLSSSRLSFHSYDFALHSELHSMNEGVAKPMVDPHRLHRLDRSMRTPTAMSFYVLKVVVDR